MTKFPWITLRNIQQAAHEAGCLATQDREQEKAPCPEHAKGVAKRCTCPRCGSYYVAHDSFGFRCVAQECGWTRDTP